MNEIPSGYIFKKHESNRAIQMHPRLRCLFPFPLVAFYLSLYVFVFFFLMISVAISLSQSNKPDCQKLQTPQIFIDKPSILKINTHNELLCNNSKFKNLCKKIVKFFFFFFL